MVSQTQEAVATLKDTLWNQLLSSSKDFLPDICGLNGDIIKERVCDAVGMQRVKCCLHRGKPHHLHIQANSDKGLVN